ncbi:putative anti-sigma regulatory factor, serine/threonine protein kinase [Melioribacter roseus P3M-2]|uniref:Putative anti-sigma regulatory factor, serine/threonine protein kinase n=1 Tax=Melioribacter roseus (strain DSM 23840 / JCM 17771 / VKM B-2668 / P3M-2) TaxID=1191523 RepID=I6YWZ0_MELRP|nr:ATP-binding protein [Melioribacter roseus]AFN75092.1 putative anti-sigma regulatory factor, serine/threonine protein kinase [Melioribacter roseus P3M-2]
MKNNRLHKQLKINSGTENLANVRKFVKDTALECGFGEDDIEQIILAVDEACTNIIKHAYGFSPDGIIDIDVKFKDDKFTIAITDEGKGFDPKQIPIPDVQEFYKQKKVGGLGIYLMRKLMDEVNYSIENKNKNRVTLVKYLKNA